MNSDPARWFVLLTGLLGLGLGSCDNSATYGPPTFADGGLLRSSKPPTRAALRGLEGKFQIAAGSELFGPDVAVRTTIRTLTITSGKEARYGVLTPGCLDDGRAVFEGYWHGPRDGRFGLVRLFVRDQAAASALCAGGSYPENVALEGSFGDDNVEPSRQLRLTERKELLPFRGLFFSMAHHGACEATEFCGVSSNSAETVRLSDQVGANAIEIDVRTTRDGVPVLFHDPSLSGSLVRGTFCRGDIAERSVSELKANCRLQHGEALPTLEEALTVAYEETELETVYVDLKVPEAVDASAPVVQRINERAQREGRGLVAVLALTKDSVTEAWKAKPRPATVPCLVEYDPDLVLDLGCLAWGPTWTAGAHAEEVQRLQKAGKGVVFWTVNNDDFIEQFLQSAKPNGMITSRAGLLFYLYQKNGVLPGGGKSDL